jgi:hypothetical protein
MQRIFKKYRSRRKTNFLVHLLCHLTMNIKSLKLNGLLKEVKLFSYQFLMRLLKVILLTKHNPMLIG